MFILLVYIFFKRINNIVFDFFFYMYIFFIYVKKFKSEFILIYILFGFLLICIK